MESLFTLIFPAASGSDSQDTVWITVLVFIILGACAALWSFLKKRNAGYNERNEEDSYYPVEYSPRRKWTWQLQLDSEQTTPKNRVSAATKWKPAHLNKGTSGPPAMANKAPQQRIVIAEVISPLDSGIVKVHPAGHSEPAEIAARKKPAEILETRKAPIAIREIKSKRKANLKGGLELLESGFLIELVSDISRNTADDTKMKHIAFEELIHRSLLKQLPGTVLKDYSVNKNRLYTKGIQCAALRELSSRTRLKETVKS